MYSAFFCALRDIIFTLDPTDVEKVNLALSRAGLTKQESLEKMKIDKNFAKSRIKRVVGTPEYLLTVIGELVELYGPMKDVNNQNNPLFKEASYASWEKLKIHIKKGCVSDKPGISLYYKIGVDAYGLDLYRCARGTSALEGLHAHIKLATRGYCYTPRLLLAILWEVFRRWNTKARNKFKKGSGGEAYDDFFDNQYFEERIMTARKNKELLPSHNIRKSKNLYLFFSLLFFSLLFSSFIFLN